MQWFPPVRPKEPPFRWTELHEAATVILEHENKLEPEAFLEWLQERPGAALIYAALAQGDGMTDQIVREVQALPMPEGELPATLSELIDQNGRIPGCREGVPRAEGGPSIAQYQWQTMAVLRHAASHPKDGR